MMKFLLFFGLIGIATCKTVELSREDISARISGGIKANTGQFPYAVAILVNGTGIDDVCSGVLVKHKWVLTTASCVSRVNVNFTILLGATEATKTASSSWKSEMIPNSDIKIIPGYDNSKKTYNLALIKVDKMPSNVMNTTNVNATVLPTEEEAKIDLTGKNVIISGYGDTNSNPVVKATLHSISSTFIPKSSCEAVQSYVMSNSSLCVDTVSGKGICNGDTGSPAIVELSNTRKVLVGIASYPLGECTTSNPMLFESVLVHREWIEKTINGSSIIHLSLSLLSFAIAAILKNFV